MTAAELLARAERRAKTVHVSKLALEAVFYVGLALALYIAGARHGRTSATVAAIQAHRDTVMDTITVVEKRLVVDTQHVRVTDAAAVAQRTVADSAVRAVQALADSEPSAPITLALPAIHVCQQAIVADTIAYTAVSSALADMTADRNAQRTRADDDERELQAARPRFGFRTGVVIGAGVVLTLVHFLH